MVDAYRRVASPDTAGSEKIQNLLESAQPHLAGLNARPEYQH
jgi:hypothetical protein